MNDVFKSLYIILKGEDRSKFFFASTILFFVVLIEVFGLGLISFLIINISNIGIDIVGMVEVIITAVIYPSDIKKMFVAVKV